MTALVKSGTLRPANGVERAALVLLALGETHGAKIWQEFDDAEVALLGEAMARLGSVDTAHVDAALSVLASELSTSAGFRGTPTAAEQLITKVLPQERATAVVERMRRPLGPDLWERLALLDNRVLVEYLGNEHPQTAALVLSRLPPPRAAAILGELDPTAAIAALSRLAKLAEADITAVSALENTLTERLILPNSGIEKAEPASRIAAIFDAIDARQATELLETWSADEAEVATRVRELMFTFDDFLQTPPSAIQALLRGLDRDLLALALKGAPLEVRARFFDQMSARAARMMEDQITSRGPVRRKDISAAQAKVIAAARDLETTGEITLRPPKETAETEDMVE